MFILADTQRMEGIKKKKRSGEDMDEIIIAKKFGELDVNDPFFNSLREAYTEFVDWFIQKKNETAYVTYDDSHHIVGFLYIKKEFGPIKDINPPLNSRDTLKIGTFKINPHDTKLGERYIKKVFDTALIYEIKNIYVTIFEEHKGLIALFEKYGFKKYGTKTTVNGVELVYHKSLDIVTGDPFLDYPLMDLRHSDVWLLSIFPKWHTRLFPDSILKTENPKSIVEDVSYTNSILKVYISWATDINLLKKGDGLIMYRTAEEGKYAEYSSVATSLCMVTEVKPASNFNNVDEFIKEILPYSVFTHNELINYFNNKDNKKMFVIKMLYNIALPKRPIRKYLIENDIIDRNDRPSFLKLNKSKLQRILTIGDVYEGIVIY